MRISLEEALALLLENARPVTGREELPLPRAAGRVLYGDIFARIDHPPFHRSPVDGYALRHEDTAGACREAPAVLRVTERVYAGGCPAAALGPGEAVRVMTGAMLPPGADCVAWQEDTDYGEETVRVFTPLRRHENFIFAAGDIRRGAPLALGGQRLDFAHAGVLAGQGLRGVAVYARPRAGILSTGDELAPPEETLPTGKIYDSNSVLLSARALAMGIEPLAAHCGDDARRLAQEITALLEQCDMVITTGGVSVGERDCMPRAAGMLGARVLLHGVSAKPGSPVMALSMGGKLILCLSGNPFGALAMFELLALPVLKKLAGQSDVLPQRCHGILQSEFPKPSSVRRLVRARIAGGEVTVPQKGHASGMLASLGGCNCLIDIPAGSPALCMGDTVEIVML